MKPTVLIPLAMLTLTAASAQAPAFPIVAEPLTLKLMGSKSPLQGEWQDLEVFKVLQNLTKHRLYLRHAARRRLRGA